MAGKKVVSTSESVLYLRRSLNNLNSTQSSGPAPILYPDQNTPEQDESQNNNRPIFVGNDSEADD
jgi:hypothetical protein